jgi:hypothetical protein
MDQDASPRDETEGSFVSNGWDGGDVLAKLTFVKAVVFLAALRLIMLFPNTSPISPYFSPGHLQEIV